MPMMCEGCGAKAASFGTPTERKRRWCCSCGTAHGAVALSPCRTMCEGCGVKYASNGTATERKRRWCGGCGRVHGAIRLSNAAKMCEGCGAKRACFGTATERKRRWCDRCGKAHGAINVNVSGTKRPRLDPPNSLLEGAAGAQVARARERMASGDATSLLLAMVKQELPVDATCQTYTLGNTCKSAAPPHPHQQPVQGLQENLRDPGTLGIVSRESWRDLSSVGLVSELRVEHVAPGSFAESNSVRAGMSLESTLHYALAGNLSETVPVVAQRIGMPVQTFRFAELSNLIRSQRPLSESL